MPRKEDTASVTGQVYDYIIQLIEQGDYLPGELLPSERELAARFNLNRMAVKNVITSLVDEGFLYRIQGKGTFIQRPDVDKFDLGILNSTGNVGMTAILKSQGYQISNRVLKSGVFSDSLYFSDKLNLSYNEDIYGLYRVRYANGEPVSLEYTYVPLKYFPTIGDLDFSLVSLYDYFESCSHRMETGLQTLQTLSIGDKEAKYLEVSPGQIVYYAEFIGHDEKNVIIEYTESYIRTDKTEFHFRAKNNHLSG